MEYLVYYMENFVRHTGHLQRRFTPNLPVQNIGFIFHKTGYVDWIFDTYNFSFILEGSGEYYFKGKRYDVTAPCVITQWPDDKMLYGPEKSWYELYFIYPKSTEDYLFNRKLFNPEVPLWHINSADTLLKKSRELNKLVEDERNLNPDRIDHLCEGMIMESLMNCSPPPSTEEEKIIKKICSYIQKNFTEIHDFEALAKQHDMSYSTFRRYWQKHIKVTPAKYQSNLITQEACRLLVETPDPINKIAEKLNFSDPLYFSKKFHKKTGTTPSEYRRQNEDRNWQQA